MCFCLAFIQPATGPSSVCEGSDVTLQCAVVRINPDNTTIVLDSVWSRDGMSLEVTNTSGSFFIPNHNPTFNSITGGFTDLVITNITLDDNNIPYTCTATGTSMTSSVVLNVTGNNMHTHVNIHTCIDTHMYIKCYSENLIISFIYKFLS